MNTGDLHFSAVPSDVAMNVVDTSIQVPAFLPSGCVYPEVKGRGPMAAEVFLHSSHLVTHVSLLSCV